MSRLERATLARRIFDAADPDGWLLAREIAPLAPEWADRRRHMQALARLVGVYDDLMIIALGEVPNA